MSVVCTIVVVLLRGALVRHLQRTSRSAQGLFGWIGAPASGLWADRQALIGQADSADVKKLESKYVKASAGAWHVVSRCYRSMQFSCFATF